MKTFLLSMITILIFAGFLQSSMVFAEDGATLYVKLTCNTCHGNQGKGMIRTEDKAKYSLKRKALYKKLVKMGMPAPIVKKLRPLYRKKFRDESKYINAIKELIGENNTKKYKKLIIEISGRVYYKKGELIPGFENYPRHAGNKKIYLFAQMKDILESRRTNGNSEAMRGIKPFLDSNKVTDDDFRSIAEYLSNVKD
ncbi:MAG: c-type cytochrome [Desulfobacteraceae bacterium]|nr:c-type cytochrome [Desulfobacteraceae bacterium]